MTEWKIDTLTPTGVRITMASVEPEGSLNWSNDWKFRKESLCAFQRRCEVPPPVMIPTIIWNIAMFASDAVNPHRMISKGFNVDSVETMWTGAVKLGRFSRKTWRCVLEAIPGWYCHRESFRVGTGNESYDVEQATTQSLIIEIYRSKIGVQLKTGIWCWEEYVEKVFVSINTRPQRHRKCFDFKRMVGSSNDGIRKSEHLFRMFSLQNHLDERGWPAENSSLFMEFVSVTWTNGQLEWLVN